MVLLIEGCSVCPICSAVLEDGDEIVMIPAFIEDQSSELFPYSDSGIHRKCFRSWPLRNKFVDTFNGYYRRHYRGMLAIDLKGNVVYGEGWQEGNGSRP